MDGLHQDGSPYINDIEFQPPSPSIESYNNFNHLASPPFPRTPSYNGSYNNSPYSGHSELSFVDNPEIFNFTTDDELGINQDYDPAEYDPPHSNSLLMFNDSDYLAYDTHHPVSSISLAPLVELRNSAPYDYSSPNSSNGGDSGAENDRRSRASSTSSNNAPISHHQQHINPSPRLEVAHSFENMNFHSPNWGTNPLPQSPPVQKAKSPPRLVMPDSSQPPSGVPTGSSIGGGGYPQPTPMINAPEGDGYSGPALHVVPATPVSGGGAGGAQPVNPFQSGMETLGE